MKTQTNRMTKQAHQPDVPKSQRIKAEIPPVRALVNPLKSLGHHARPRRKK